MTTAVVTPAGAGLGTFGASGVGAAAPTGLDGLFGMVLGGQIAEDGSVLPETEIGPVIATAAPEVALDAGLADAVSTAVAPVTVQVGDLPIQVRGDAVAQDAVQAMTVHIQVIYQQLVGQGGFQFGANGQAGDLAAALTKLGMPAEQAQQLAARIDTMMSILQAQQDALRAAEPSASGQAVDMTGLVAVLLASMGVQVDEGRLTLAGKSDDSMAQLDPLFDVNSAMVQVFQVSVQVSQTVTVQVDSRQLAHAVAHANQRSRAGLGIMDGLLGQDIQAPVSAPISQSFSKISAQPHVDVALFPTDGAGDDMAISLQVALPDVAQQAIQPHVAVVEARSAAVDMRGNDMAATVAAVGARVRTDDELKEPEGVTVFKLKEHNGVAALQALAVTALEKASDSNTNPNAALSPFGNVMVPHLGAAESASSTAATGTIFERMAQAQAHGVAKQVQLQVQSLGDQGGGQVRMILNPPDLGRVDIQLKIHEGMVSGSISATDSAVVEQLARDIQNLRQSFTDAGLKVGEQGISLMLNNNPQQQSSQQGRGEQAFAGRTTRDGVADDAAPLSTPASWIAPDRIIDVRI